MMKFNSLFLLTILFGSAMCQYYIKYGITDDGAASQPHHQSNRFYYGFRWNAPTSSTGLYYTIGTTENGTDIQGSTQLPYNDPLGPVGKGVEQVHTWQTTSILPEGVTLYITMYDDQGHYAKETFTVGSDLYPGAPQGTCNPGSYWQPIDASGVRQTPVTPTASFSFDPATGTFGFGVHAHYILFDWTYVIDFTAWNHAATGGVNGWGLGTTNCENRAAADISAASPALKYSQLFNAAPTALYADDAANPAVPLNSKNFWAYKSSGPWSISPNLCDGVYYTSSFSFSDLFACTDSSNTTHAISVTTNAGNIVFAGSIHVTGISPLNSTNHAGYQSVEWEFPFRFLFNYTVSGIGSSDTSLLNFQINRVYFVAGVAPNTLNLRVDLETNALAATAFVDVQTVGLKPFVLSIPAAGTSAGVVHTIDLTGTVNQAMVQDFSVVSNDQVRANTGKFSGQYSIQVYRRANNTMSYAGVNVTLKYILSIRAEEVQVINTGAFALGVSFKTANDYMIPTTQPYQPSDTIFVRTEIMTNNAGTPVALDAQTSNDFSNTLKDVYLCRTTNGNAPTPSSGCRVQIGNVIPMSNMYSGGSVADTTYGTISTAAAPVAGAYKFGGFQFPANILANALGAAGTTRFFLDVTVTIGKGPGLTREVRRIITFDESNGISSSEIDTASEAVATPTTTGDHKSSMTCDVTCVIGLAMGGVVLLLLVLVVVLLVRKRSNKKKKDDMLDFSDINVATESS